MRPCWPFSEKATLQCLLVGILALLFALAFQGKRGLWDPDEGRYSNIALNMLADGEWVVPYRHPEHPHFSKPPLIYWAIAASVAAFGENEAALRLPSAMAFAGTVVVLFFLAGYFCPRRRWLPSAFFASMFLPYAAANMINADFMLAFFETLAVWFFWRAWESGRFDSDPTAVIPVWISLALAFLTKGPPALLPLAAMAVFLMWQKASLRKLFSSICLIAFAAIALPWYVYLALHYPGLMDYFLRYEVYGRIFTDIHHRSPGFAGIFKIYLPTLLVGALPWGVLAGIACFRDWVHSSGRAVKFSVESAFLLCWLCVPLGVFFLAQSRLSLYLLPLFVPIALWAAKTFENSRLQARHAVLGLCWVCLLLGFKWSVGHFVNFKKDAKVMAAVLRSMNGGNFPQEIVFVDRPPSYGLRFYTRAMIEYVTLESTDDPAIDERFDEELRAGEPDCVWIGRKDHVGQIEREAKGLNYHVVILGSLNEDVYIKLVPIG